MFLHFLKLLLQLIISPARGWEDISRAGIAPSRLCREGYYPMIGLIAVTTLLQFLYDSTQTLTFVHSLQMSIINVTSFFVSLFLGQHLLAAYLPKFTDKEPSQVKIDTFVIFVLSVMTLFVIISNLIPIELEIMKFFSLYSIFVVWKGLRYLDVNQNKTGQFVFLGVFSVVIPPFLLRFLFTILMPEV